MLNLFIIIVSTYLSKNKRKTIEGELRCGELAEYLDNLNTKKYVWLCEDGSGINASMKFDPVTNQIIGAVLPINQISGMPESFTFKAKTAADANDFERTSIDYCLYSSSSAISGKCTTIRASSFRHR